MYFLEKGDGKEKERERNINMRVKHWLVVSHMCPDQERYLTHNPGVWLDLGIKVAIFPFARWCPTNWAMWSGCYTVVYVKKKKVSGASKIH